MDKEKVVLSILYFRLLFNGCHEAQPIIKAVPSQSRLLSGITKVYPAGRRYCFSRVVLFKVGTTFGLGKWLPGPSCGSKWAGAPGNSEELVLVDTTSAASPEELGTEWGLPSMVPSASNSSGDLIIGLDLIFTILRTWKSIIKSAKVISHGHKTSASMLRMLGVDEYSQLDHKGVPGSKSGTA
ncbi:hypothetical protein Cgig2_028575 [Carnegiea gigantea]|uniref:Uncharacterized protein n=1 Tax=Carnegiea gigantea TaxID=171969 RepID=A0A9Q1QBC2_9CARY|nr:hypothetical protein Cgig2_028575 [Carnegiea gigantea]